MNVEYVSVRYEGLKKITRNYYSHSYEGWLPRVGEFINIAVVLPGQADPRPRQFILEVVSVEWFPPTRVIVYVNETDSGGK